MIARQLNNKIVIFLLYLLANLLLGSNFTLANSIVTEEKGQFDRSVVNILRDNTHPLNPFLLEIRKRKLYLEPEWIALLHYKEKPHARYRSEVASPWFFMSEQGKTNPQAELEATLTSFFKNDVTAPMRLSSYCRFVARRQWIYKELSGVNEVIPDQACPEFDQYKSFLKADYLSLIFPAAHPNSPASAFGHTLLRFDRRNQDSKTKMLNMSVNFAAEVPKNTNPVTYALLGLTGGFVGRYTILPYHVKLREYGQIDNRDIWEYQLNFSNEQMDLILRHSYELLIAQFDYFFFHENCAYQLLSLLDVATPDDRLTKAFSIRTIPVDTIKLLRSRNLILRSTYVPSTVKIIDTKIKSLKPKEQKLAISLQRNPNKVKDALQGLETASQSTILEILADELRFRRLSKQNSSIHMSDDERKLLTLRSKLGISQVSRVPDSPKKDPSQGHGTQRVAIGFEEIENGQNVLLSYRPAYHSLGDSSVGYGSNTAIEFLGVTLAIDPDGGNPFLRKFTLLDIRSLEPRTALFKPLSWRTSIDWEKYSDKDNVGFNFFGEAGLSFLHRESKILGYIGANLSVRYDRDMENSATFLTGGSIGSILPMGNGLKLIAEGGLKYDLRNGRSETYSTESLNLTPNQRIALKLRHEFRDGMSHFDQHLLGVSVDYYF